MLALIYYHTKKKKSTVFLIMPIKNFFQKILNKLLTIGKCKSIITFVLAG